jgi:hypothetical protein
MGEALGIGAGVPPLCFGALLVTTGGCQSFHTFFLPLLTQINLARGVSPKLPTLEHVPPALGAAAIACGIASEVESRNRQVKIESLRIKIYLP